jgi:hypothetical protein
MCVGVLLPCTTVGNSTFQRNPVRAGRHSKCGELSGNNNGHIVRENAIALNFSGFRLAPCVAFEIFRSQEALVGGSTSAMVVFPLGNNR